MIWGQFDVQAEPYKRPFIVLVPAVPLIAVILCLWVIGPIFVRNLADNVLCVADVPG